MGRSFLEHKYVGTQRGIFEGHGWDFFSILKIIIPPEAPSPVTSSWCPGCVSSVAAVNDQIHVINAVMATVIARMRV